MFVYFQAEDGIRYLVRSRGLGDVYKRQAQGGGRPVARDDHLVRGARLVATDALVAVRLLGCCLLYTSDAADERSSVDLGGRRIIKKKNTRVQVARVKEHVASYKRHIGQMRY